MNIRFALATSAAVLVAVVVFLMSEGRQPEAPSMAAVETQAGSGYEPVDVGDASAVAVPAVEDVRRNPAAEEPAVESTAAAEATLLRVILEGVSEEEARGATISVKGRDERDRWPMDIGSEWPSQGLTSEFDLDPILASVERDGHLRDDELEVAVYHPRLLGARTRLDIPGDVVRTEGKAIHEVRVRLVRPEFWPELTLSVRDAHTREHLEGVELRIASGPGMAAWGRNDPSTLLGDGLTSPIALMGGRDADEPMHRVAGMALSPAEDGSPRIVELARRWAPGRGVRVTARAPGYAWGATGIDVTEGERELLLEPATALEVRLTNVQLERYAALDTVPMLCVYRIREDGGNSYAHFARLDETLETEGLRLESLVPGGYRVVVELGGGSWPEQPVLAREELAGELALTVGETRAVVLTLDDPPAPPERAALGGRISFPAPTATWGEEHARLQVYFQPTQKWRQPDFELPLADLRRAGGALPTWSFRLEDIPVGSYRLQLMPFLKVWVIDLPAEGREDLELALPEFAEVLVETVDARTGERVPRDELHYRRQVPLERQRQNDFTRAATEAPGLFRFWTAPGEVMVWPKYPTGPDRDPGSGEVLELVPGFQSVRLEVPPVYAMRFEFREGGVALPVGDPGVLAMKDVRGVGHEGRVTFNGLQRNMRVEVSAPGLYDISFEGLQADSYHPIPPQRVDVRRGEATEVIVDLRKK